MNENDQSIIRDLKVQLETQRIQLEQEINKRRQSEDLLKETEARYRAFFDQAVDGIMIMPMDGEYVIVNNAFAKMHGYDSPQEMEHLRLSDYDTPETAQLAPERLRRLMTGEAMNFDVEHYRKDGQKIPLNVSCNILNLEGKRYFCGLHRDITEKKRAEAALRESEEKFRLIAETSIDEIAQVNMDGIFTYVSPSVKELSGYEPEEVIGTHFTNYVPESYLPLTAELFKRVASGERIKSVEFPLIKKDGSPTLNEISITPIMINSQPVGIQGIVRDVSDKINAQNALKQSEEKYRLIVETSTDEIFQTDNKGTLIYVSPGVKNVFGYEPDEVIGTNFTKYFLESDLPRHLGTFDKLIRGEAIKNNEATGIRKDGSYVNIEVNASPIFIDGKFIGVQGIARDVSERVKTENALKESHDQLKSLTKHLMSVRENERIRIGHELHDELGQVLTAINLEVSAISNKLTESQQNLKSRAQSVAELAVGAIQSVKRIISELRPTLLDDLGLAEAIRWQAREYQNRIGIKFNIAIEPEDISLDDDISIAIFRIFQESITNAIRHSHATKISVRLNQTDTGIELRIKDDGIGIADDQVSHNGSFGIQGIRERVELFNGTIDISGIPGKGTTLIAKFPV